MSLITIEFVIKRGGFDFPVGMRTGGLERPCAADINMSFASSRT